MLNHNYEIIKPKHWTNLVSPRSKISMHFFYFNKISQSTSGAKSSVILPADFVLEPGRQGGRGEDNGNDGWSWGLPDYKAGYLCSKGIWNELKDAGGMSRNQLRVERGGQRWILGWVEKGSHDVIIDSEEVSYLS